MTEKDVEFDLLVIGAGPCGLASAISAQRAGFDAVVVEAQVVVSTIAQYPTYARFFSTAEKLSLGGVPFVVATEKPSRRDALAYYRAVIRHFGPTFDKKIKPWVLPDFVNRTKEGEIAVRWDSRVSAIESDSVLITGPSGEERLPATFVYVMTGFAPTLDLLRQAKVPIDAQTGIPEHDPATLETSVPGIFIAGVVVAGYDANKVFIENGRYHGEKIVARLLGRNAPSEPKLSVELDT
ncbi:MAG: NAD(P)-binding domain-containing protein [Gemmatimonadaceae bacterium]|nr:NAD(P)-binding domain-containing protein [Gemmatimonadaceae bacterium]